MKNKETEKTEKDLKRGKLEREIRKESKNNKVLNMYFGICSWRVKNKIKKSIKGNSIDEKKQYVKEVIATELALIEQWDTKNILWRGNYFDGVLTEVLNKHKDVNFRYKDWSSFWSSTEFDSDKAKFMMNELFIEFEIIRGKKSPVKKN